MGRHRAPEPGDPGWSHPDVVGSTDPAETARIIRAAELAEQQARDRIAREAAERLQQEQHRRQP